MHHCQNQGIPRQSCRCLQYKYKANGFLETGKVSLAIEAYQKALDTAVDPPQQGAILYLRAAAYLQRAAEHRESLKEIVQDEERSTSINKASRRTIASQ